MICIKEDQEIWWYEHVCWSRVKNSDLYIIRYEQSNAVKTYFKGVVYLTWQYNAMEFFIIKKSEKNLRLL